MSHLTSMGLHVGEVLIPQNYKSYLTSKKDALECFLEKFIRLIIQSITTHVQGFRLFTYAEYKTDKNYTLEHTKPLFNKLGFLTLYNLYTLRVLVEFFKILKIHSPISLHNSFNFCPRSCHYRLLVPKCNLGISKNNYTVSASISWNKCIGKVLDPPVLSTVLNLNSNINHTHSQIIIPGSNNNLDMTMYVCMYVCMSTEGSARPAVVPPTYF